MGCGLGECSVYAVGGYNKMLKFVSEKWKVVSINLKIKIFKAMITEADIEASFAEEILGMIKNPQYNTNVATFCQENHLDRNILTSKKLFGMTNRTLFRVMLGIAQLVPFGDYVNMCIRIANITYKVAEREDGSPEAIKRSHAGSPIGRKRES